MAIFGWSTLAQAEVYTRAANRKKLAKDAMPLLLLGHSENEDWRTFDWRTGKAAV